MNVTPEIVAIIANIIVMLGGLLKLEGRLTALETAQKMMLDGLVKTHVVERRHNVNSSEN